MATLVLRRAGFLRAALLAVLVAWGAASILGVPAFMSQAAPAEVAPPLRLGAALAVALYVFAAWHFLRLLARRGRPLLLAIVVALILLCRSDGDRRLQPRLAPLVVGVASPDGPGLRRGRIRSADRVPTRGLADRRLRWPLPGRHPRTAGPMARRGRSRTSHRRRPRVDRSTASSIASASTARRPKSSPSSSTPGPSCVASTTCSGRTCRGSSPIALAPIRRRLASEAARSAR